MARPSALDTDAGTRIALDVRSLRLTYDQYYRFCMDNRDLRIELSAQGEMILLSPTNPGTGQSGDWKEERKGHPARFGIVALCAI